ncbi:hypothetical protein HDU80_001445 [Chytriomyces hyalinus]|nr:hypothetical protein HDU80_001445 [Chytriomyces hyalinus]
MNLLMEWLRVQATDTHNIEDFCQANPDFALGTVLLAFINTHTHLVNVSDSSLAEHALASGIQLVIQDTLHEVLAERTDPENLTKAVSSSLADLLDHCLGMFTDQLQQEKNPAVTHAANVDHGSSLREYLVRMNNNSSVKGKVTERKTQALLQNAFLTAMVHRCDLELERENKTSIVVECKDSNNIVPRAEIEKFEQVDCRRKNMEIRSVGASFAIFVYGTSISHAELDTLNDHMRDNNVLAHANVMIGAQIKQMEKIKKSLTAILKETKNSIALAQQDCTVDILSDLHSILMQGGQVDHEETESEVKMNGAKKVTSVKKG